MKKDQLSLEEKRTLTNCQLLFFIEIVDISSPGDYEKDAWAMSENEKVAEIPKLKEEGNQLYKTKKYELAAEKYSQALGLLERLIMQ